MRRVFRDVYSPVLPKDAPISYGINVVLINGKENFRSNVVTSMRLINDPPSLPDDEAVTINWTPYNGWDNPQYLVQEFNGNSVQEGWRVVAGPMTDTMYVHQKPKPKGKYQLRIVTRNPAAPLESFSNPIDYEVPGRDLEIPNVITPNGDGMNDFFDVGYSGDELFYLQIYDRWGTKYFESRNRTQLWDGKDLNGKDVADGVYFYTVEVGSKQYSGSLSLLR
jgi:gliding motility-associated-like protein